MTPLEQRKLSYLKLKFPSIKTPDEALNWALQAEQTKRDCGFSDPAFLIFAQDQRAIEELALLLEKEGNKGKP